LPVKRSTENDKVLRGALWLVAISGLIAALALVARTLNANYTTDLTAAGGTWWDFRDAGYFPVRAVLDGLIPYDVDAYFASYPVGQEFPLLPPMYMVLHAPFQLLGLTTASIVMLVLNVVGIGLLTAWSLRLGRYRLSPLLVLGVSTLVIVSSGGRNNLFSGQATLVFVAGAYLALTASDTARGAVGIFITLIKLGIGAPVTVLVAASGRYRRALIGAAVAGAVSLILMMPFVVWAGGLGPLVDILLDNAAFSTDSRWISLETTTARVDMSATMAMILDVVPSQSVQSLIAALVIGGSAFVLFRKRSVLTRTHFNDAVIVLVCLATVTSIYHSFYDLVILILPTILLTRSDFAAGTVRRVLRHTMLGALLVASFNPFRVEFVASMLGGSGRTGDVLAAGLTGAGLVVALGLALLVVWQLPEPGTNHIASAKGD
jgi:hypothetical protein